MNEQSGRVFSIAEENPPIDGCTISTQVYQTEDTGIMYFSMSAGTNISAETYEYPKLCKMESGNMEVFTNDERSWQLSAGDSILLPQSVPVGMRTTDGCIYTEFDFGGNTNMNQVLKSGEVFKLKDLLPYQDGKIINMDLVDDLNVKFVIMSFAAGTGLAEHAAPGEALIFALDGQGSIGYEGKEYNIKTGESFKFAKNCRHYVKADGNFNMALLLTLKD